MTQRLIDKFHLVPGKLDHSELKDSILYEWPGAVKGFDCYLLSADATQEITTSYRLWFRKIEDGQVNFVKIPASVLNNDPVDVATEKVKNLVLTS